MRGTFWRTESPDDAWSLPGATRAPAAVLQLPNLCSEMLSMNQLHKRIDPGVHWLEQQQQNERSAQTQQDKQAKHYPVGSILSILLS